MTMSKRDFERIADGIRYVTGDPTIDPATARKLVNELVSAFSTFNPRFDEDRFRRACGIEPGTGRMIQLSSDELVDRAKRALA